MATYIETLGKLQQQSLDALKQAQATQLAALGTIADLAGEIPAFGAAGAVENLPTFAELTELNAAFARTVLEQQNAYASQFAALFTVACKNATDAAGRAVQSATTPK
ncbi:MAG TPA: hypothetical protein VK669_12430 [Candidatus Limnocylindrales bacterium]|nr:hypothetical protein [Candidatus Limnocylindrales bacterium]